MTKIAALSALLAATALVALGAGSSATAQTNVGRTTAVNQSAELERSRRVRSLVINDPILFQDQVITSDEALVQVLFVDGSALTVGANSRVIVDEFVFDPAAGAGSLVSEVAAGSLRFVGGKLSKQRGQVSFKTRFGTLGVRGGIVDIDLSPPPLSDGRQPDFVASLIFGEELVFQTPTGVQRVHRQNYSVVVIDGAVLIIPTALLNTNSVQERLTGASDQSGGSSNIPTSAEVIASGVPAINSQRAPIFVLPRPRPDLVNTRISVDEERGIINQIDNIVDASETAIVFGSEIRPGDGLTPVEQPVVSPDRGVSDSPNTGSFPLLLGARSTPDTFVTARGSVVTNPAAQGISPGTDDLEQAQFVTDANGNRTGIRTITGAVLPFTEATGQFTFTLSGADIDRLEGAPSSTFRPIQGVYIRNGNDFAAYYFLNDANDIILEPFFATGIAQTATSNTLFFGDGRNGRVPELRTYNVLANPYRTGTGVPTEIPLLNPIIASAFGSSLQNAATTDLLIASTGDQAPSGVQAALLIDGAGVNQRSVLALNLGLITETVPGLGDGSVLAYVGSRRGTYRLSSMQTAVSMEGPIGAVDVNPDASLSSIYGENGETFVLGSGIDNFALAREAEFREFFDDQINGGPLTAAQTASSNLNVAALASQTPLTAFDRVTGDFQGYAAGMVENSDGSAAPFRSQRENDFQLQTLVAQSAVGGVINVQDTLDQSDLSAMTVPFGLQRVDGVVVGSTVTETYIDDDRYAAIENTGLPLSVQPDAELSGINQQVSGVNPGTYVVASTLVPQGQLFTNSGVTPCTCEFLEWGWWGTQADTVDNGANVRRDVVHLGTWAAGHQTPTVQLPTSGRAFYDGHVVGNVARTDGGQVRQYVAAGGFRLDYDFTSRNGMTSFDFDGRRFGGGVSEVFSARGNRYTGILAGAGLTGDVSGSFVRGPQNNHQGTIGSFSVLGTDYGATGTFVAQQATAPLN
ncbi:MAG: hypothetical protein AAF580_05850 [Pseudomonadota bacterium]